MSRLRSAVYELKTLAGRSPLALPIERARRPGRPVRGDTELVIESFPRSASSFVVTAIHLNEPIRRRISNHTHMAANVIEGVRRGLPTLVIARDPADAVASFLVHSPGVSAAAATRGYARFYEPLLPLRSALVVATFDEVTRDLGEVVERLNQRFDLDLRPFEHTPEAVASVEEEIRRHYRDRVPDRRVDDRVAAPTQARRDQAERARARHLGVALPLRRRAELSFKAITAR